MYLKKFFFLCIYRKQGSAQSSEHTSMIIIMTLGSCYMADTHRKKNEEEERLLITVISRHEEEKRQCDGKKKNMQERDNSFRACMHMEPRTARMSLLLSKPRLCLGQKRSLSLSLFPYAALTV